MAVALIAMLGLKYSMQLNHPISRSLARLPLEVPDGIVIYDGGYEISGIAITRSSVKNVFGPGGLLGEIPVNAWAHEYEPGGAYIGRLIEGAVTNGIRNNTMVDAVAGTPGTPPTNWTIATGGVTVELVEVSTINGIKYVSYRFSGTPSSDPATVFETSVGIDALDGETWTTSVYAALIAGDTTNLTSIRLRTSERTEGGGFVRVNIGSDISGSLTSALQRFIYTAMLSGGGTVAHIHPDLQINWDDSGAIDLTLRIGLPGEVEFPYATSVIKTATVAVTRAADVPTISSPPIPKTWLLDFRTALGSGEQVIGQYDDGTEDNRYRVVRNSSNEVRLFVTTGGVEQIASGLLGGTVANDTPAKAVVRIDTDNFAITLNGAALVKDTAGSLPTLTTKRLGRDTVGNYHNSTLASETRWADPLSDDAMRSLAA